MGYSSGGVVLDVVSLSLILLVSITEVGSGLSLVEWSVCDLHPLRARCAHLRLVSSLSLCTFGFVHLDVVHFDILHFVFVHLVFVHLVFVHFVFVHLVLNFKL